MSTLSPPQSLSDCVRELHDAGQYLKLMITFLAADATLPEDKKEVLDAYLFNAAEKVTNVVMKLQEATVSETVPH
jgi:hypothetical protein